MLLQRLNALYYVHVFINIQIYRLILDLDPTQFKMYVDGLLDYLEIEKSGTSPVYDRHPRTSSTSPLNEGCNSNRDIDRIS